MEESSSQVVEEPDQIGENATTRESGAAEKPEIIEKPQTIEPSGPGGEEPSEKAGDNPVK